jgi:uroporphyrinogen decarboxylase
MSREQAPCARRAITDRYYRVMTYQDVDRVPDIEFGYWPQTLRRWAAEGMPVAAEPGKGTPEVQKVDELFGFEPHGHAIPLRLHMNPAFLEEVIEKRGDVTVMRDSSGVIAERYLDDVEESSIPHFVRFPVETPDDWRALARRYRLDDPTRLLPARDIAAARAAAEAGRMISVWLTGFYYMLRSWMGMENLSLALYDHPAMIEDMVTTWAEICARQIEQVPADVPIDYVMWWEDMAGRNGPLISPAQFRKLLQPGYRRVMDAARRHGCVLSHVDCDGNPHDIVANWLEEGVNVMFPLEVQAGVDPSAWRREFGRELRFRGGIAKEPLVQGGAAIDRELERIRPLMEDGGYVPHLDHLVPPTVSYANYLEYLSKKRKLIGR